MHRLHVLRMTDQYRTGYVIRMVDFRDMLLRDISTPPSAGVSAGHVTIFLIMVNERGRSPSI